MVAVDRRSHRYNRSMVSFDVRIHIAYCNKGFVLNFFKSKNAPEGVTEHCQSTSMTQPVW